MKSSLSFVAAVVLVCVFRSPFALAAEVENGLPLTENGCRVQVRLDPESLYVLPKAHGEAAVRALERFLHRKRGYAIVPETETADFHVDIKFTDQVRLMWKDALSGELTFHSARSQHGAFTRSPPCAELRKTYAAKMVECDVEEHPHLKVYYGYSSPSGLDFRLVNTTGSGSFTHYRYAYVYREPTRRQYWVEPAAGREASLLPFSLGENTLITHTGLRAKVHCHPWGT